MKITIYELLGLIKDGKAPKKIKYEDEIWECSKEEYYSCKDGSILLGDLFFNYKIQTFINDEVEIIEEDKKIEKIDLPSFEEFKNMSVAEKYVVTAKEYDVLNDLIESQNIIINKALKLIEQSDYKEVDNFSPIHIDMAITTLKDKK